MNNKASKSNNALVNLYIIYISISLSLSGVIIYYSEYFDNSVLKLWDEFFIIVILLPFSILEALKNKYFKDMIILFVINFIYLLYIISNIIEGNVNAILYQTKLDLPFLLMIFITNVVIKVILKDKNRIKVIKRIANIFIKLVLINSIIIIFQSIFKEFYVEKLLKLHWGAWGIQYGLSIKTASGNLRCIGLLQNHVVSGDLMLIGIIVIIKCRKFLGLYKKKLIMYILLIGIALYFTTYKIAYLGFLFFIFLYFIEKKFTISKIYNNKYFILIIMYITGCVLVMQYLISNTIIFYSYIDNLFPKYAYNSIFKRIEYQNLIINNMNSIKTKLIGIGMGVNGIYGISKEFIDMNITKIPLDSTYIYIISNYGFIMLVIFIILFITLIWKLYKYRSLDILGARYLINYLFVIQFLFNNIIISTPIVYIYILITLYTLNYIKFRRRGLKLES